MKEFDDPISLPQGLRVFSEMLNFHRRNTYASGYNVLHATSKVACEGKAPNAMDYIKSQVVRDSMGKLFRLRIIGYVISPRTFGARLKLCESQLELWGMDDQEVEPEDVAKETQPNRAQNSKEDAAHPSSSEPESGEQCRQTQGATGECCDTVSVLNVEMKSDRFYPTSGKGSRAHLTLGCAPGTHARVTGFDLINVVSCEQRAKEMCDADLNSEYFETYSISNGTLRKYEDGLWVIYPEQEVVVNSLFSAYY